MDAGEVIHLAKADCLIRRPFGQIQRVSKDSLSAGSRITISVAANPDTSVFYPMLTVENV